MREITKAEPVQNKLRSWSKSQPTARWNARKSRKPTETKLDVIGMGSRADSTTFERVPNMDPGDVVADERKIPAIFKTHQTSASMGVFLSEPGNVRESLRRES